MNLFNHRVMERSYFGVCDGKIGKKKSKSCQKQKNTCLTLHLYTFKEQKLHHFSAGVTVLSSI